jgi:N-acetylglucosaminyl-diphospho-decaprenol L-rhamnosyltransferase
MNLSSSDARVAICVLNWNAGEALVDCLQSLQAGHCPIRTDIVVVDNASMDCSVDLARQRFPEIPVIVNSYNMGYAAGNNVGARHLIERGCEFLIFINPDVILEPGSHAALIRTLLRNPKAGCAGGVSTTTPPRGVSTAARTRPSGLEKLVYYGPLNRIGAIKRLCREHFLNPDSLVEGATVYAVSGACIAFRTEAFRQIGGFDEKTFLYEEEFIVAERLLAREWQTVLSKEARYLHVHGLSTGRIPYRRRLHFIASEQYLLRDYYQWSPVTCSVLKIHRYIEWLCYALVWWLTNSGLALRRHSH